jgi:hypothetical protein
MAGYTELLLPVHRDCCCPVSNPLSAMVAIWRHIIVSFQVIGTERVGWNLDILGEMHQ